jgi:hypothetical protein
MKAYVINMITYDCCRMCNPVACGTDKAVVQSKCDDMNSKLTPKEIVDEKHFEVDTIKFLG